MIRLRKIASNKFLRCVFASAVLFYALFPLTGFCACPDCECTNKIRKTSTTESDCHESAPTEGGCCCGKPEPKKSCCSKDADAGNSTDDCQCDCSDTKLPPPTVQRTVGESFQELEEIKAPPFAPFTFPLIPEAFSECVFLAKTFETPVSRLPVRLHLLLLTFLN